jgi:hypothetical protein
LQRRIKRLIVGDNPTTLKLSVMLRGEKRLQTGYPPKKRECDRYGARCDLYSSNTARLIIKDLLMNKG